MPPVKYNSLWSYQQILWYCMLPLVSNLNLHAHIHLEWSFFWWSLMSYSWGRHFAGCHVQSYIWHSHTDLHHSAQLLCTPVTVTCIQVDIYFICIYCQWHSHTHLYCHWHHRPVDNAFTCSVLIALAISMSPIPQ